MLATVEASFEGWHLRDCWVGLVGRCWKDMSEALLEGGLEAAEGSRLVLLFVSGWVVVFERFEGGFKVEKFFGVFRGHGG